MEPNNFFTFFHPIIESFSKGSLIKKIMSYFFGLIGGLSFAGGAYYFFKSISYVPDFWSAILLIMFLFASYLSMQIWFYRANAILKLEESDFTVIPIVSQLLRAIGEVYALFLITIGAGGVLMLWFSHYGGYLWPFTSYIPLVGMINDTFIGGLLFLIFTVIIAFFILMFAYFLAENVLVLVQIAKNTSGLLNKNTENK